MDNQIAARNIYFGPFGFSSFHVFKHSLNVESITLAKYDGEIFMSSKEIIYSN